MSLDTLSCDVLVIGSGPGGSTSATLAAEAGRDVILCEEGPHLSIDATAPYSLDEMTQKWRNGGLTPAFGRTQVTYIEGRCVGGASEINAALFHSPLPSVLDGWASRYGIDGIRMDDLAPYLAEVESTFSVSRRPDGVGRASENLHQSAQKLGWKSSEIARFWRYSQKNAVWEGRRQSMTEVMIPRFQRAGGRLLADTRVLRLELDGDRAVAAIARQGKKKLRITFNSVFVCAGAVQTPLVLRRSGIRKRIGDTLTMNPMIRVVAEFDEPINDPRLGVPVHQIEQFKPKMTLGCSHAGLAHLGLWMAGMRERRDEALANWRNMVMYYVKIGGEARGRVRSMPVTGEALVYYPLPAGDLKLLGEGLVRLGEVLFAGGARKLYDPIVSGNVLTSLDQVRPFEKGVPAGNSALSAIHLHSTVPMGTEEQGAADSYGRLHGWRNVYVNDSSLLPDTPAINPQGLILAIAHRNIRRFLA